MLETVSRKLEAAGEVDMYDKVFLEQLEEGAIEEFNCSPEDFHKYNRLPHRAMQMYDEQSIFKIHPV